MTFHGVRSRRGARPAAGGFGVWPEPPENAAQSLPLRYPTMLISSKGRRETAPTASHSAVPPPPMLVVCPRVQLISDDRRRRLLGVEGLWCSQRRKWDLSADAHEVVVVEGGPEDQ
jgi:hypothetical protein